MRNTERDRKVWAIAALLLVGFALVTLWAIREEGPATAQQEVEGAANGPEREEGAAPAGAEPGPVPPASAGTDTAQRDPPEPAVVAPAMDDAAAPEDGAAAGEATGRELADTLPGPRAESGEEEERQLRSAYRADQARVLLMEVRDSLLDCIPPTYPGLDEALQFVVPLRIEGPGPGRAADHVFVEERDGFTLGASELACIEELLVPARFPPPVVSDGVTLDGRSFYRIRIPIGLP